MHDAQDLAGSHTHTHTACVTCHKHTQATHMRSTLFNAVRFCHTHIPPHAKFNFDSLVTLTLQRFERNQRVTRDTAAIPRKFHDNSTQILPANAA